MSKPQLPASCVFLRVNQTREVKIDGKLTQVLYHDPKSEMPTLLVVMEMDVDVVAERGTQQ